jgi:hypothetical protein
VDFRDDAGAFNMDSPAEVPITLRRQDRGGVPCRVQLEAGTVIGQGRLAAELGVSTTPLREAVRRLAARA